VAHATGITEFPDNGSEQGGRGGAWIARASDPLAVFYNPAGLAGQPTRVIAQSNINFQKTCFTRTKATNDPTDDPDQLMGGQQYPQVCSANAPAIDPQIAMTYHLSDRIGIGFAPLLAPSGGASAANFPEFVKTTASNGQPVYEPAPNRYMLTSANLLVLTPTLGVGAEIIDRLRVGASFQWGIASLSFTNAVAATANTGSTFIPSQDDVKAVAKVHDYFFPGFTLGAMYSATDDFDIAAWFKWSAPINATGDITTTTDYYSTTTAEGKPASSFNVVGNTALPNCGDTTATTNPCGAGNNLKIKVTVPMEAKVGFRYHKRRSDVPYDEHVRDPMAQDIFDVELDLTYANDSAFQQLQVTLPGNNGVGVIPIAGIPAFAPPNASVPQGFKDVVGVRLGGDVNVLRDQLALRGGTFFQSNGQNSQYQNIAFAGSTNFGLAIGATYRLHFSKEKSNALEISAGYEHVFYLNENNDDPAGTPAIAGTQCPNSAMPNSAGVCPGGTQSYRTAYAINEGQITNSINVLNVGLGYKF
jgi:long-chain fatty acid transport protein